MVVRGLRVGSRIDQDSNALASKCVDRVVAMAPWAWRPRGAQEIGTMTGIKSRRCCERQARIGREHEADSRSNWRRAQAVQALEHCEPDIAGSEESDARNLID